MDQEKNLVATADDIAIVILAAGNSSRMGSPKQQLLINGESLLEKTVNAALDSEVANVMVVLGSNVEQHTKILSNKPIQIIANSNWKLGMGNTLKFSVKKTIEVNVDVQAILFMVCDQPMISARHIKNMIDVYLKGESIVVASSYKNTLGVPVLFDRIAFSFLLSLGDKGGAKEFIKKFEKSIKQIPFEGGEIDLDTPEDYKKFISELDN